MLDGRILLRRTNNGLDVFRHYIKGQWKLGAPFRNPYYDDKIGSFNIFKGRDGLYLMHDFGNSHFRGDCFKFVGLLCGLNAKKRDEFVQIIRKISNDMSLGMNEHEYNHSAEAMPISREKFAINPENHQEIEKKRIVRPYVIKEQPFRESELNFWGAYSIDKRIFAKFNVISIAEFSSENAEGRPYRYKATSTEPIFGYKQDGYVKIYRPFSSLRFQYLGDVGDGHCFGLEQLPSKGDMVFITGGEKDVLSLAAKGFNAICFNSEVAEIDPCIIETLHHRFKHIVVLFDMDKTGVENSIKLANKFKKYGIKRMELPLSGEKSEKDVSDYFKIGYTRRDFLNLFIPILDKMYSSTMTILSSCEIDQSNPPRRSDDVVSLAGVPLGTGGNLLGVTGGEGSGKSNYVATLIAGAISDGSSVIDTLGATVAANRGRKAVLLYDTEQSEVQLYNNTSNLLRRANLEKSPDEFKAFSLTALPRKERLEVIIQSLDRYYYECDGIHLVVIDGIADLVRCANDEAESIAVIEELYRLAGIYNTCIICVLHFVPNGLKLRGHLGSEVQRKAAAILSIEKDKNPAISVVKALKVREGSALDIPLMQFSWSKERRMHTYVGEKSEKARVQRKRHDLRQLCTEIFEENSHITWGDMSGMIQNITSVSERTAADYIKDMTSEGIIVKDIHNTKYYIKGL